MMSDFGALYEVGHYLNLTDTSKIIKIKFKYNLKFSLNLKVQLNELISNPNG